jgi:outer membrane protein TolC
MTPKIFIPCLLPLMLLFAPVCLYAASEGKHALESASDSRAAIKGISLTLSEAIALGLRNNRDIKSAYLQRVAQKFDLRVAEYSFTPKLVLSGSYLYGKNQDSPYTQNTLGPVSTLLTPYGARLSLGWAHQNTRNGSRDLYNNDGATFTLIQPLLRNAGREVTTAPRELARLSEAQNRLALKATVAHTVTEIAEAYRAFQRASEEVSIMAVSLNRASDLVEVNRALIRAGRMAEVDIVQTEADVANQELTLEQARDELDRTRLALLQLLALDLRTSLEAASPASPEFVSINLGEALKIAKNTQPAFLSQLINNKKDDLNVLLARNGQLWDVSLVAGASQIRSRSEGSDGNRSWDNYVGIQVEVPVGDLRPRQAALNAEVNQKVQRVQSEEMEQKLTRDIYSAANDVNTRWKQYGIAQRAYQLTRQKVDIERQKLAVGRSSNFQVLSFETDLRNAENARLSASISYQNAITDLDEVMGTTLQSWDISFKDDAVDVD